jgi:hypothetical protein
MLSHIACWNKSEYIYIFTSNVTIILEATLNTVELPNGKVPLFLIEVFQNAIVEFLLACWAVVNRFCIMLQIMIEFGIQNFTQVPRTHLGSKEHDPVKSAANAVGLPCKSHASAVQVRVRCHASAISVCRMPHGCRYGKCPTLCPLCQAKRHPKPKP